MELGSDRSVEICPGVEPEEAADTVTAPLVVRGLFVAPERASTTFTGPAAVGVPVMLRPEMLRPADPAPVRDKDEPDVVPLMVPV